MRFGPLPAAEWILMLEKQQGIVRCLLCSTLVIAVTWLVHLCAIRRSAALRHRVFSLGFAALLMVPVAIALTAGWNPMVFSSGSSSSGNAKSRIEIPSNDAPGSSNEFVTRGPNEDHALAVTTAIPEPLQQAISTEPANPPVGEQTVTRDQNANGSLARTAETGLVAQSIRAVTELWVRLQKPQNLLGASWGAGGLLLGIRLVSEWLWIRRIVREGVPITDEQTVSLLKEIRHATQSLTNRRSIRGETAPRLLCSVSTPVPIAVGILVPTIILPVGFGKWTSERLRIVLMHELAHIDRRDVLAHLLAHGVCVLYWFNPLVWLAARRMCLERELACDDFLLCLGESAERYANQLVEIAVALQESRRTAQLAAPMATQGNLTIRVQHLIETDLDRRFVSSRASLLTAVAAVMTLTTLAAISPSFGIAQDKPTRKISDRNDIAVTLSGELSSDWIDQLKAMPNLSQLTIRNPAVQNLDVARLRELKNLTQFSAEDFSIDTRLADIVALNIAQLPRLKSVQFHRTGLTGRGLEALSRSAATELILDGEELLTDTDFKHVAAMPSLSSLVLDSTPIDVDGLTNLQAAAGLRRLVLRRHPAGSYEKSSAARVKAIAGLANLEELELGDTGYSHLVALKASKSLRRLTLRHCGGSDALKSLKQLTQVKRVEFDSCDTWKESFEDLKSGIAATGMTFADVTRPAADSFTQTTAPPDEATSLARRALEELDVGQRFPSFWIDWHLHWSKVPSMTAEPIRTVHRLKLALTAEHEKQPWEQDVTFAYAPGQGFMRYLSTENDIPQWQQTTFGDARLAWSREGRTGSPFLHILRSGFEKFEDAMTHRLPMQLHITHQHLWWGTPTQRNVTTSPISPRNVAYIELPEESLAGESCRVFQAPGRSERLWVSQATGRLRGALHYIHQGYFTPFYKQDVVTKILGRRVESHEDYKKLWSGPNALAKDVQQQLNQVWAEYEFSHAYPGDLVVLDDYREIAQGTWFPFKVSIANWHHNSKNEGQYDFTVSESIVKDLALDRNDLKRYWAEYLPQEGDKVQDQRYGVAVEYPLDKDRTDDDVQTLVNAQMLELARSAVEIEIAQSPFQKMIGKPAPQLPVEGWVGERPELAGKRYLLHFWSASCGPCKNDVPVLNSMAKNRIVIGVHPGDTAIGEVSRAVKDSNMDYPTVIARSGPNDIMGYPVKMFPYCVEVDEQGNVAKHGFLEEMLTAEVRKDVAVEPPNATGTVVAIDANNGLAVIALGESDGIQVKQRLDVVRDGKSVARLRVLTLYKNRCVGRTTDEIEPKTIQTGDKALSFAGAPGE